MTAIDAHHPQSDVVAAASCGGGIEPGLAALRELQRKHAFWDCRLLAGFAQGAFSRDNLRYIFLQYHRSTSSFTRLLAAVMVHGESDLFRARLAENRWDEGGGCDPERRHAQRFRNFLHRALGVDDAAASCASSRSPTSA